ncbi:2-oxo-4-hydroxy-4-carboxy-5-ureidoimidazoline decarboxylase [Quadrisphaera sp. KR29]|uniref:2-oxo-4-hydroxy-4-carboxy-5-ureidoimidazoline decarboxylase n=1 Tax=Quadrisphaera sp. KR29 TaxID=3461391 RepID=UPI0040443AD4
MSLLDVLLGRTAPTGDEAAALAACLDSPLWVASVLDGAPYADVEALLEQADAAARALPGEAVLAALSTHPRIGERPAGDSAHARMSRLEQSGVASDADTQERLAAANAAYEARFGHVFLVRAAGLTSQEVLAALEARLGNDAAAELEVAADQLRQIALLRLQAALAA